MAAQQEVSRAVAAPTSAAPIEALVDEADAEGAIGRTIWDEPEIDGSAFLNGATWLKVGGIVRARVTLADEYDVWGEVAADT
jgi:ribosomal protein S12 methylthiotransferase